MFKEFKDFALKGNFVDMAVGIVIGAAFSTIVKSFVSDIIMPVVGVVTGGVDFSNLFVVIKSPMEGAVYTTLDAAKEAGAVTINYGIFVNALITFVIVAFVLFMVIKGMNNAKKALEEEQAAAPPPGPSAEVELLTEIRDSLAK
ncbi:MAG: large conductance mechanosensitive channel protein MscL [Pseudomonadales bacterium]|nr:large conductance mechanosensitive channel protein MscL [Pseudomonadales bacterium]MDG2078077.1 large conductance mechanosensitive channel protein MscL [Pseudomonadales bacterium]